ncbi:MAG: 5-methyltetrahydrofolate--homocysteine methyltransferase [Candidatus Latescibacterota bacterium]|nr:MAG: 5-methyltetrahydrofolate--homocysteine methyltransferase [Candidatus Latescibacterota bacterium]
MLYFLKKKGGHVDIWGLLSGDRPAFLDGAMGTELIKRGLRLGDPPELWNLEGPEKVLEVQRAYVEAGAQVLLTNTFGGNRLKLRRAGMEEKLEEVNRRAVEIAKEASGGRALVAGNLGPTGEFVEPYGTSSEEDFYRAFVEQAEVLASSGVDLFVIETMSDLKEVGAAVRACREFGLPVAASMSFEPAGGGFRTMMGVKPQDAARALEEAGADMVGTNCGGISPEEMAQVVAEMGSATQRPIFAEPNAGRPELVDGRAVYKLSPEEFVEGMRKVAEAGAKLLGGCCGTTPEHIRLLVRKLG